MMASQTYLALGDSMSIDDYTGFEGGGAVNQFFKMLGEGWTLDDRTFDGCQMEGVPRNATGNLITLTIGGNDLLWNKEKYLREGLADFAAKHKSLITEIRHRNPDATFIVGDIYAPAAPLTELESEALHKANAIIHTNCQEVGAIVAGIHTAFRGQEDTHLCLAMEPTLKGATAIAQVFHDCFE